MIHGQETVTSSRDECAASVAAAVVDIPCEKRSDEVVHRKNSTAKHAERAEINLSALRVLCG